MRPDQTAQDVAVVAALPQLHTLYLSCIMANSVADSESMGDRFWEAHTRALVRLVRERGIRGVFNPGAHWRCFERAFGGEGGWRRLGYVNGVDWERM